LVNTEKSGKEIDSQIAIKKAQETTLSPYFVKSLEYAGWNS